MENSKQPAFPPTREMCELSKIETYPFGLTKREYFAGLILSAIISNSDLLRGKSKDERNDGSDEAGRTCLMLVGMEVQPGRSGCAPFD